LVEVFQKDQTDVVQWNWSAG